MYANFFKQVCCVLSLSLMLSGCGGGAGAGGGGANVTTAISWTQPVYGTTDPSLYTGVVAGPPDDQTGGWNLATKTWTTAGSTADIVFDNYGKIGAVGVARSQAGFNTTPEPALTYGTNLRITGAGDVFVIVLRNGRHAKLRIDSVTSGPAWYSYSSISFTYLLEQGAGVTATPICTAPPSAPTAFAASQTAFGTVTFTWQPSAGATSYTLYSQGTPGSDHSEFQEFHHYLADQCPGAGELHPDQCAFGNVLRSDDSCDPLRRVGVVGRGWANKCSHCDAFRSYRLYAYARKFQRHPELGRSSGSDFL